MTKKNLYSTPQDEFWAGDFGEQYIKRNQSERLPIPKIAAWSQMLRSCVKLVSAKKIKK